MPHGPLVTLFTVGRREERNGCLKWHACSFDQVSADNNNTLVMKSQTPY